MSRKIAEYMQLLSVNVEARAEYHSDPDGAMTGFGLSVEEQTIVASGDPKKIRAAVESVDPKGAQQLRITF
jgi:hypothetical protein